MALLVLRVHKVNRGTELTLAGQDVGPCARSLAHLPPFSAALNFLDMNMRRNYFRLPIT